MFEAWHLFLIDVRYFSTVVLYLSFAIPFFITLILGVQGKLD
jgi:hypothetical protein